jgi:crossover junction endodeoxyribonuclease RuvC
MVFIEDYAYSATGKVFHIAENMAILKNMLVQTGIKYTMISPTAIKKFATGKGNANKEKMYESFKNETGRDLEKEFELRCDKNPISDIVDSYWLCKYGFENFIKEL